MVSSSLEGPSAASLLTEVRAPERFVSTSRLTLARMTFHHEARPEGSPTRTVHRVEISGPLSGLFARLLGCPWLSLPGRALCGPGRVRLS